MFKQVDRWTAIVLVATALTACEQKATPPPVPTAPATPTVSEADKALLERMKAKEAVRAQLQSTPSHFIHGGPWENHDKGIIHSYTKATAIEFSNDSDFDVSDLEGNITYVSGEGATLGMVPFTAQGEVPAGRKAKLPVTAGEITGKADKAQVTVARVRIHG